MTTSTVFSISFVQQKLLFDAIESNDLSEFNKIVNNLTSLQLNIKDASYGYNPFIYACKLHRYEMIKILLSKNIDPFLYDNDKMNGVDHLISLLKKEKSTRYDINKILKGIFKKNILYTKQIDVLTVDPAKVVIVGEGSYGKVWMTNLFVIVKEYKIKSDTLYNLMNEIVVINKINKYYNDITPKLKRKSVINGKYNIYFDKLKCTLSDVIRAYEWANRESKFKIYNGIFVQLLKSIKKIHEIGILHCDLKSHNIMLNYDNDVRIIDFGLSHIFNYGPSELQRENIMCTPYVESFDEINIDKIVEKSNQKSYHSDIFSLGMIFFECITSDYPHSHHYINDRFIKYDKKLNKIYPIKESTLKKMMDFSEDFVDLMKIMLNYYGTNRWAPDELLQHKFFGGKTSYIDIHNDTVLMTNSGAYNCTLYTNDIIKKGLYEMLYFKEIHNAHVDEEFDDVIILTNPDINNKFYLILVDWLMEVMKKFKTDYIDIFVNMFCIIYNYLNLIKSRSMLQGYGIAYYYIISEILWQGVSMKDLQHISAKTYTDEEFCGFIDKIFINTSIDIKSINVHITYITINLQMMGIETGKIYEYMCKKIIIYTIFRYTINPKSISIWDTIQALFYGYYSERPTYDFLTLPKDDPYIDELNSLPIMNNPPTDSYKMINQLYKN